MNFYIKNIPNLAQQSLHYCSRNYCIDCSRFHCSSFSRNHCTYCSCLHRFMMTLNDAVDLVIYAFQHGHNGDLFVQKAPAATLQTLASALKELLKKDTLVKVIGTRHGEKLYETLVTREEMARAEDMGNYYRIPCDTRDLNYDKYFVEGQEKVSVIEDYHSHNTHRLSVEEMKSLLLQLSEIRERINGQSA